ncbi:MAG: ABC transporter permease [Candidatus Omnitrophica bacterium]|nr:ABC transporter permease [Candidatus Omnitrophota bacterium]
MRYELFIALRYIFGRHKEKFISVITVISILGVSVGVAALIATLAVMSGFDNELKMRIIGSNPHIFIEKEFGITNAAELSEKINNINGVKGSFPYVFSQAIIEYRSRSRGVMLRSFDPSNETDAFKVMPTVVAVEPRCDIQDGIILGSELASSLGAYVSDEIILIAPSMTHPQKMKVTGIFKSGMYDYDANIVYAGLSNLSAMLNVKNSVSGIGVDCVSISMCDGIKAQINKTLGTSFAVWTYAERNRNLFSAIKLEKLAMFVILTLIVMVACFSIVAVLTMTVMEKKKDIGVLKAIGVTKKGIITIFSIQGLIIGLSGVMLGFAAGAGVSFLLKNITLPRDVYYIDRIPIKFSLMDSAVIAAAAIALSILAAVYPAYQASKLNPVEALRYE